MADQEHSPTGEQDKRGRLNQAITNAVVSGHSHYVGRGPQKAHTFYRHNVIVVLLQDPLTIGERSLVAAGRHAAVDQLRYQLQQTMRDDLVGAVEQLTGGRVQAFMSANHIDPDLAVELFMLDRPVPSDEPPRSTHAAD